MKFITLNRFITRTYIGTFFIASSVFANDHTTIVKKDLESKLPKSSFSVPTSKTQPWPRPHHGVTFMPAHEYEQATPLPNIENNDFLNQKDFKEFKDGQTEFNRKR